MDYERKWNKTVVDGHAHMGSQGESNLDTILAETGTQSMNLVSIQDPHKGSGLAESLVVKAQQSARFYVFAGLNHANALAPDIASALPLADQAREFHAMGCDGIKLIESKPTARQTMDLPVTADYYRDFWATAEELDLPMVWHVGDPEEFWDPERIPTWAKQRGWGYGPDDVALEDLYAEVDRILDRHPALRIIFPHFYFLSTDLQRAGRFLDAHPRVSFDLAPGVEMLYNISRSPEAGREFFTHYSDRIVFGTDIFSHMAGPEASARAGLVRRWLETDDEFRVPPEADFLLGPASEGVVRGLDLDEDALRRIYRDNFQAIAGVAPKALDVDRVVECCARIARVAGELSGTSAAETPAGRAARQLRSLPSHRRRGDGLEFCKYHGLGNDYVVIEPEKGATELPAGRIRAICDRHCGIGSDGILFGPLDAIPSEFPCDSLSGNEQKGARPVRIYNPDGSEAEKSGNGLRIFARHLHDTGRLPLNARSTICTLGGAVRAVVEDPRLRIRVSMGRVRFDSASVPMTGPDREVIDEPFEVAGESFRCCAASVGNPHCVVLVENPTADLAWRVGPRIEVDERFPNRTNVQFMRVEDRHAVRIEIWERGAGYTLASGSSASACAAAASRLGLCESPVSVHMPGGTLEIKLDAECRAELVGPVTRVASGALSDEIEDASNNDAPP